MPDSKVRLEIVTPDSTVYSEIVEHVVVPTANGKIDLFQRHAPLIDRLEPADVKIVKDGKTEYLAVSSGFVEVYAEKVSIITDQAILIDEDDQEKIEEAVKRAEEALDEGRKSNIDEAQMQLLEAAAKYERARKLAKGKST
ncbi:MAG: ATP synthase F1 subunit epsilon [Opitutae bacterium]|nr:ATP synthase F1 subunit epsilon [Opitutae bacterium]MEC9122811.1 ATP synthase F1 subunit epsilon [Verrucomicrobiota bacterium]|tara:strand:- start:78 stop:500 length:423 start_codon:yes stop_codon:yes gene_type:complete